MIMKFFRLLGLVLARFLVENCQCFESLITTTRIQEVDQREWRIMVVASAVSSFDCLHGQESGATTINKAR